MAAITLIRFAKLKIAIRFISEFHLFSKRTRSHQRYAGANDLNVHKTGKAFLD